MRWMGGRAASAAHLAIKADGFFDGDFATIPKCAVHRTKAAATHELEELCRTTITMAVMAMPTSNRR